MTSNILILLNIIDINTDQFDAFIFFILDENIRVYTKYYKTETYEENKHFLIS